MRTSGSKYTAFFRDALWSRRKNEVAENEERERLISNCKKRPIFFPSIHPPKGIFHLEKSARDSVNLTSSHLLPQNNVHTGSKLYEEHSGFTGNLRIAIKETTKMALLPKIETNSSDNQTCDNDINYHRALRVHESCEAQKRLLAIEFMKNKIDQCWNDRRERWERIVNTKKWRSLHSLFFLITKPEHRFCRSLSLAYTQGSGSRYSIPAAEFTSLCVNNYAFSRDDRQSCLEYMSILFEIFDDDFDELVDWRIFLCHINLLLNRRKTLEEQFSDFFQIYSNEARHEGKISLAELYSILQTPALQHEQPLIWEEFKIWITGLCEKHINNTLDSKEKDLFQNMKDVDTLSSSIDGWHTVIRKMSVYRMSQNQTQQGIGYRNPAADTLVNHMKNLKQTFQINNRTKGLQTETKAPFTKAEIFLYRSSVTWDLFRSICIENQNIRRLLEKFSWDRIPASVRLSHFQTCESKAVKNYQAIEMKVRWHKASMWWRDVMVPRNKKARFLLWKNYAIHKAKIKRGLLHWWRRGLKDGFVKLEMHTERCIFFREQKELAAKFLRRLRMNTVLRAWKKFWVIKKQLLEIEINKAVRLYNTYQLELFFQKWRKQAYIIRKLRMGIEKWRYANKKHRFEIWSSNVKEKVKLKQEDNKRAEMRQKILTFEIKEERERLKALEKQRKWEAEQERLRLEQIEEEKKQYEKFWELEKQKAYDRYEGVKLMKQQEDQIEHKLKIKENEEKAFEKTWKDLEKQAIIDAKREAGIYLNTQEGIEHMEKEVIAIQNDAENMTRTKGAGKDTSDSDWKKLFDPVFESYFFYNPETGEKVLAMGLSKEEGLVIAKSNYISEQVKLATAAVQAMKQREAEKRLQIKAAKKLQAAFKIRKARAAVYQVIVDNYVKRVDPSTGNCYYYNLRTKKSAWTKPLNLGSKDLKPLAWNLRLDADGKWYYENRTTPWLSSPDKPPHYLQCLVCNLQLATLICDTCEEHYCLDCFEQAHPERNSEHKYERLIKLEPKQCIMCKDAKASNLCKRCGLRDYFCDKCHRIAHARKVSTKRKEPHVNVRF